jgi:hypothetical protein
MAYLKIFDKRILLSIINIDLNDKMSPKSESCITVKDTAGYP